ncbi:uncharacterized protein LOC144446563 [Glandiceps talaboti]
MNVSPRLLHKGMNNVNNMHGRSGGTKSLPASPFSQRRIGSHTHFHFSESDGECITSELPPLLTSKPKGIRKDSVSRDSSVASSPRLTVPPLSPAVSPSLRRNVLRKFNPLMMKDTETDDSVASGSPRLLSPVSQTRDNITESTHYFGNSENRTPTPLSPSLHRTMSPHRRNEKIGLNLNLNVGTVTTSVGSSPRHSPLPSPRLRRHLTQSSTAGSKVGELTLENVKAFEATPQDDSETRMDNTISVPTVDVDRYPSKIDYVAGLVQQNHYDQHHSPLITAKLSAEKLNDAPVGNKNGLSGLSDDKGKFVDAVDLDNGVTANIHPQLANNADDHDNEDDTMRKCQEWLSNVQLSPKYVTY